MIKGIALLSAALSMLAAPQFMPKKTDMPPPKPNETTVIVGILHTGANTDQNFTIEGDDSQIEKQNNRTTIESPNLNQKTTNENNSNDNVNENKDTLDKSNPTTPKNNNRRNYRGRTDRKYYDTSDKNTQEPITFDENGTANRTKRARIGNAIVETDADEHYNELKAKLDERFASMFALKEELDFQQNETSEKWNEYYLMRQAYERQLKRIIADWVMNISYSNI